MISLELLGDGILVLDRVWRIRAFNNRAAELMHSAYVGLLGGDFWEAVQPQVAEMYRQTVETSLRLQDSHVLIARQVFEDQWIEYTFTRHEEGLVVTLRDATESQKVMRRLRDSEHRNFVLFGLNPTVMWIFDVDTLQVVAANQAAVEFYGIKQKAFLNLDVETLFPDGEAAPLLELAQAPRPLMPQMAHLLLCRQKVANGVALTELACSAIDWKERPCILVSLADLSERHFAETSLRQLNDDLQLQMERCTASLQLANRDLDAFAQAMSHDLKDPLHVLNGFARALGRKYAGVLDVQGMHYVERIQATTRQLAKLVDDLRTLARLPRMPVNNELVDLSPLCAALARDLRRRDPARADVLLEIEPNLLVQGDRELLTMALTHLLDNAWKFTARKAQPWIRIGFVSAVGDPGPDPVQAVPEAVPEKILSVSDNGAGFDAAYQDKLFMSFQRLHSSADFAGNGLGLSIVRRATVRMGGRVWAESIDGTGATFFMAVPVVPHPDSIADQAAPDPEPDIGQSQALLFDETAAAPLPDGQPVPDRPPGD